METKEHRKKAARCAYMTSCFMAEDLKCFGYKPDCALYQKSNGEFYSIHRFNQAMNDLIDKVRSGLLDNEDL